MHAKSKLGTTAERKDVYVSGAGGCSPSECHRDDEDARWDNDGIHAATL